MTEDEIMRQLSQAVRDDDLLAAEDMVTAGQQQHPEWDWPFLATVLWIQRGQVEEEAPGNRPGGGGCTGWPRVATGEDRPRLRRRVREPCTRTRTGRLPTCWAATWPAARVKGAPQAPRPFGMAYGHP